MRILVRLPNWLGDVVMSFAFIDALRNAYPECVIDVIIKEELREIVSYYNNITEIIEFSKEKFPGLSGTYKFGKKISKQHKYDIFFCLPNSFSSAWMGFFTGSKIRIGYKKEFRNFLLTHSYKENTNLHRVEGYVNLLTSFKKIQISNISVTLIKHTITSNLLPKGKNLLLNINSEAESRKIPIEFAERLIIGIISKYELNIILTGGKKDILHMSQLECKLNLPNSVYNYAGKTDLLDLIKIVSEADYVMSTDSGIAHLANALSINTIVFFGAGDENKTKPYNTKNLKIIRRYGLPCAPCVSNKCIYDQPICLTGLDIKQVLLKLDEFIK
jgi:lipopolysaccharide heptosyltransferase II